MKYPSYDDCYWEGKPDNSEVDVIYGTKRNGIVIDPTTDKDYLEWLSTWKTPYPWPIDENRNPTMKQLDFALKIYGLPISNLVPLSKNDLIAYANEKQWALATGGYTRTISGAPLFFKTDEVSWSLITGKAARLLQPGAPQSFDWQFDAITHTEISTTDFLTVAIVIADFMQATFDAVKPITQAIIAGTITTKEEIDSSTLPVNHS